MKSWSEIVKEMEKHQMANDKPTTTIKVGDRVEAPKHGRGKVLAIVGDNAWVQTEVRDYPLTFDIKKLKPAPKPRQGTILVTERINPYNSVHNYGEWYATSHVQGVELTDEVREQLAGLL